MLLQFRRSLGPALHINYVLCIYVSIYMCIYVQIYRYNNIYMYIFVCFYVSIGPSIYVSMYLCMYLSIYLSNHPSIHPSKHLCIYVYTYHRKCGCKPTRLGNLQMNRQIMPNITKCVHKILLNHCESKLIWTKCQCVVGKLIQTRPSIQQK